MRRNMASYHKRRLILIPTFAMLVALIAATIYFKWPDLINQFNPPKPIEATKDQIQKDPILTGEEFFRAMAVELWEAPESESARRAFNMLAGIWHAPPIPENSDLNQSDGMERAAQDRDLRLYRFSGNLGALLHLDYPAMLELTMPGTQGKRFISLVGRENEHLLIDPPIAGRRSLSFSELEKHWSGQGFLLWKDFSNLLTNISPGSKGDQIKRLQDLLREVGAYSRPLTGVYDNNTLMAVKEFQSSKGIEQDGIVGGKTLMLLYRSIDRFEVPRLTAG
jgi:general secretion pathway protein A